MFGMLMAYLRLKVSDETAPVGHDKHLTPWDNLKEVRIDRRVYSNAHGQLFGKFACQRFGVVLTVLEPATWQFPFIA